METTKLDRAADLELGDDVRLYRASSQDDAGTASDSDYVLYFDVVDELVFAARYRDRPSVAVLDGRRRRIGDRTCIELTGFSGYQYVSGPEGWYDPVRGAVERRREEGAGAVAGFFASISGTEGGMSPELVRLHMSLFNQPQQVALVLDPQACKLGMYVRRDGRRFVNVPFSVAYRAEDWAASDEPRKHPELPVKSSLRNT
jgi:hypothetical protein